MAEWLRLSMLSIVKLGIAANLNPTALAFSDPLNLWDPALLSNKLREVEEKVGTEVMLEI